jgi:hypothetical protein
MILPIRRNASAFQYCTHTTSGNYTCTMSSGFINTLAAPSLPVDREECSMHNRNFNQVLFASSIPLVLLPELLCFTQSMSYYSVFITYHNKAEN